MDRNLTKDPYARRYLREVKTTTTKFIANSGCILGFCMGFSLISGAEVVFHIVAGLFSKKRLVGDVLRLKERCKRRSYKLEEMRKVVITSVDRFQVHKEVVVPLIQCRMRLLHRQQGLIVAVVQLARELARQSWRRGRRRDRTSVPAG